MNKSPELDEEALAAFYAEAKKAESKPSDTMAMNPKDRIAADGTPVNSRRYRLRVGKVRGESKLARRMRRNGVR